MKISTLTVGLKVRHAQYGVGTVKAVSEHLAEIRFDDALRSMDPEMSELTPAEANMSVTGLDMSLHQFVESVVDEVVDKLGIEQTDTFVDQLAVRWQKGKLVLHPSDPTLQTKEIPLDVFFHKIVGLRNQLRVLEQKVNAHPSLTDADKVEMQQYVSRCYGSLTTFNLLFKRKEDQFSSKLEG